MIRIKFLAYKMARVFYSGKDIAKTKLKLIGKVPKMARIWSHPAVLPITFMKFADRNPSGL